VFGGSDGSCLAESFLNDTWGWDGTRWTVGTFSQKFRGREGMGMGDYKMAAMMGAFLGLMPMMFALMIGSVLGALAGLAVVLLTKEDASTYEVPFGSFMGIGALAVAYMEAVQGAANAVVH